jgi:hypothetical protein
MSGYLYTKVSVSLLKAVTKAVTKEEPGGREQGEQGREKRS